MDLVIIILGILFLLGCNVGKGLAICAIIEGVLVCINEIIKLKEKKRKEEEQFFNNLLGR